MILSDRTIRAELDAGRIVIDPRDWSMATEFGGGQYGLSLDPTGKLYTCSNSAHIETFMYDARYAARVGQISPPLEGHGLKPGDRLECAVFPKVL